MARFLSLRTLVAAALAALFVASMAASERSASAMSTAAGKFLAGLTPEQRQVAAFPFDSGERLKWHFIPSEMFPRNGLTLRAMSEAQRKLAHDLLKAGVSQRGYMTATTIIELETILGDIEAAGGGDAGRGAADGARSREVLLLGVRHAGSEGRVGLARRGPSRLAALHGGQRHAASRRADVLRHQPRRGADGTEERVSAFSAPKRTPAARC